MQKEYPMIRDGSILREPLGHRRVLASVVSLAMLSAIAVAAPAAAAGGGFPPIMADGQRVQADVGSCNNDWATVSLDKTYKLTRTGVGTYNLEVKEDGPFTTIAGTSPGACESGTDNGNLVAAGVTGKTHQRFDAPVTSSATPDRTPECGVSGCAGTGAFLDAVFGSGSYTSGYVTGDFSWTAHYQAGSNGTYFDTSVDWPFDNRGDITGS
jgi:hypothetical protein